MKIIAALEVPVLVCAFALSGCSSISDIAATPTVTSPASPSPTSTPDVRDPATWIVSPAGIGPFVIGANLTTVAGTLAGITADDSECPNPNAAFYTLDGISIASILDGSGNITGISVGNPFQNTDAATNAGRSPLDGPHSATGIGYGSTVTALTAAYPTAERTDVSNDDQFPAYTVKSDSGGWITFSILASTQLVNDIGVWPGTAPPSEYCG